MPAAVLGEGKLFLSSRSVEHKIRQEAPFVSLCMFVHYFLNADLFLNMNDMIACFQPWNHLKPQAPFRLSFGAFANPSIVSSSLCQIDKSLSADP